MVSTEVSDDLTAFYLRHWKLLRGLLKRRTGSLDLAEDALQETWLRLASMTAPDTEIRDRQAFILRLAGNIATDLVRRERRHSSRAISDEAVLEAVADSTPSPETFVIDRDQLRQLVLALAQLPAKPRAALLMSRCDGLSHAEISTRLKVSESMVAKYLVRALCHCRDHFRRIG
ncbi:RNA polymerase sigma factor [Hyphomicrobium sp. LHD-15]|uniref:RNA polymerase sigma factor n=1 Tax=Hyphomicrobium sp. LHD-15 TaxID=3072142 RepID=UPI0028106F00|nr:RNA polymerase sigma factor [Hyphomicrobium sp. LHD-15]MDQ8698882.1 RNA polymerase sigma factor [Hyphomicrobium sp. LHD-15]